MTYFWQLSGPDSHFERAWGRVNPNETIANVVFANSPIKAEMAGVAGITLTVGIKDDGSSHILVPDSLAYLCNSLRRWKKYPYPSTEFASLSPLYVETRERLFVLLDERQNTRKVTKAKKEKKDVSKANGKFCGGPRNLTRANFERGRTFWHLLAQNSETASMYGLPYPWWIKFVSILSFSFIFWRPDGSGRVSANHLLIASVTELDVQSKEQGQSWCFRIEENSGLQNADELESSINGVSTVLPQKEALKQLQDRLSSAVARGPVVLLLHEFGVAERDQLKSLGFDISRWVEGLGPLLGFDDIKTSDHPRSKKEERDDSRYAFKSEREFPKSEERRSRSPPRTYAHGNNGRPNNHRTFKTENNNDEKPKPTLGSLAADDGPSPPTSSSSGSSFYVVSVAQLYKAATGRFWERISPSVIFDMLTRNGQRSDAEAIPRNVDLDSTHIMQSWLAMVKGPFIDEQMTLLENQFRHPPPNNTAATNNSVGAGGTQSNPTRELEGLHAAVQPGPFVDPFNDDDDDDWGF